MARIPSARTAVRVVPAVLLGAALLTGCGLGAGPITEGMDPAAARPSPVTTPGPALWEDVSRRMAGEGSARFTFSGTGGGETVSGTGAMRFDYEEFSADVALTMPATGRVRAVLLPTASYLALPAAKGLPTDKPWLKLGPIPTSPFGKRMRPVVEQLRASFDPEQGLGLLRSAVSVEEVGPATVEDVPTTRHHAVVDLRQATLAAEGAAREQYRSMLDAGLRTLQYDVWLDTTGLPRRFSTDLPTAEGLYSVTGTFRAWGQEVRVEAPRPRDVFDADKLPD